MQLRVVLVSWMNIRKEKYFMCQQIDVKIQCFHVNDLKKQLNIFGVNFLLHLMAYCLNMT